MADPPEISATVRVVDGDPASLRGATLALASFSDVVNSMRPILPDGSVKIAQCRPDGTRLFWARRNCTSRALRLGMRAWWMGWSNCRRAGRCDSISWRGDGASVSGVVTAARGPLSGALVVLIPRKQPGDPTDNHGYQADSDGSFKFPSIKPGEYYLFATDDWQLEWGDPTKVKPYLALAKVVKADPEGRWKHRSKFRGGPKRIPNPTVANARRPSQKGSCRTLVGLLLREINIEFLRSRP